MVVGTTTVTASRVSAKELDGFSVKFDEESGTGVTLPSNFSSLVAGGQEGDGCPVDVFASYLADSANSTTGE